LADINGAVEITGTERFDARSFVGTAREKTKAVSVKLCKYEDERPRPAGGAGNAASQP